jgi:hypothetical protein
MKKSAFSSTLLIRLALNHFYGSEWTGVGASSFHSLISFLTGALIAVNQFLYSCGCILFGFVANPFPCTMPVSHKSR